VIQNRTRLCRNVRIARLSFPRYPPNWLFAKLKQSRITNTVQLHLLKKKGGLGLWGGLAALLLSSRIAKDRAT